MSNTTEKVTKTNRHYGEGSIYQRKDGRWVAKYRDEAMAKPQYLYGSTEAEVLPQAAGLEKADGTRSDCVQESVFS